MLTLNGVELLFNDTFKSLVYNEIWNDEKFDFNAYLLFNNLSYLKKSKEYTRFSSITLVGILLLNFGNKILLKFSMKEKELL